MEWLDSPLTRRLSLDSVNGESKAWLRPRKVALGLTESAPVGIGAPFGRPYAAACAIFRPQEFPMAKPATVKIKLVSSADTGFFYVTKKNPRNTTEKMSFRKYDPVVRKHVDFKEAKIK